MSLLDSPAIAQGAKDVVADTRVTGYSWTWWDGHCARRRPMWRIADKDEAAKLQAERVAFNNIIQGTGSDFLLRSMIELVKWIRMEGIPAKVCLPVHDSLLLEAQEDYADEVIQQTVSIMTGWNSMGVPLTVDVEKGPSWGDLKKIKKQ